MPWRRRSKLAAKHEAASRQETPNSRKMPAGEPPSTSLGAKRPPTAQELTDSVYTTKRRGKTLGFERREEPGVHAVITSEQAGSTRRTPAKPRKLDENAENDTQSRRTDSRLMQKPA